jgi:formiminoglutamase
MLKNYVSVINQYNGRIDSTEDYEAFRWHQIIKPLDLNTQDTPFDLKLGFAFIGFCCDLGVQRNKGRAGAKDGPAAIRGRFTNYACRFSKEVALFDAGNIITEGIDLEEAQELLEKAVQKIRSLNLFPIVLGGGHETTFGHYMGQLSYLEDTKSSNTPVDLAILNFDAHFDNRPYDNGRSSGTMFRQIADLCEEKNMPFGYMPIGIQKHSNTVALFREADKRGTEYVLASEIHNDTVDVVSKKIDKRAVVRNKIKRRMREAYKAILKDSPNIKWISLIFSARKDCVSADFQTIKAQISYLLYKATQKYD